MTTTADVLVVTPHADDAEYGVAGTVARWTKEGRSVMYVVCTNGDKGTSDVNMNPKELSKIREKEQLAAAELLGVRDVVFLRNEDQGLEDTPEFRKQIVRTSNGDERGSFHNRVCGRCRCPGRGRSSCD